MPHTQLAHPIDANDRLRKRHASILWSGMIAATLLHFGVFAAWPEFTAPDIADVSDVMTALDLPAFEIPPPPAPLTRPAVPVMTTTELGEDLTISPTTFDANPPDVLTPPPAAPTTTVTDTPRFTPFTVAPTLKNRDTVVREMERSYPPLLRDAGIGGQVYVFFHIDEEGRVIDARVHESSGHQALDEAALAVAYAYQFTPALNRDQTVAVWVSIPVSFRSR